MPRFEPNFDTIGEMEPGDPNEEYTDERYGDVSLYVGETPVSTDKIFIKVYDMDPDSDGINGERDVRFVENEVTNHLWAASVGVSPKLYGFGYCVDGMYLKMERIKGIDYRKLWYNLYDEKVKEGVSELDILNEFLTKYYWEAILCLHRVLYHVSCWDSSMANIMWDQVNNRCYIIDYGYSFPEPSFPDINSYKVEHFNSVKFCLKTIDNFDEIVDSFIKKTLIDDCGETEESLKNRYDVPADFVYELAYPKMTKLFNSNN